MEADKKVALVVTTKGNGVFFGYGVPTDRDTIELEQCRMCLYWADEAHGVVGLAANGVPKGSRVSPAAPRIILREVYAIMVATDKARLSWEKEPWS